MDRAALDINSTPWARVYVDGRYVGDTPLRGLVVAPGRRKLKLENPAVQRTFETVIVLAPGERRVLPVDLVAGNLIPP